MLWIVLALLTGVAALSILLPLARAKAGAPDAPADVAFYEAQISEIDRDVERGLISQADADAACAEAGRRLIAASKSGGEAAASSVLARRLAALAAIVVIPGVALALYARIGNPDMPDQPLSARLERQSEKFDIAAAVARIEAHLAANPDDGKGYEIVAPVYLRMGRAEDAIRAYDNAIRLLGDNSARRTGLAEARVYAAEGIVTAEARKDFEAAVAVDPKQPVARYYLGLAAEQDGDKKKASDIWTKLLADSPADSSWAKGLRARIAALDPAAAPPEAVKPAPQGDAAAAIAAMPKDQQTASIRGMVDGLAQRLSENGQDRQGWLRLVRAWSVLGEKDKAKAALADARKALAADPAAAGELDALARELGLEG
jgi:cytochrome c-type biogenesis protein CcmH